MQISLIPGQLRLDYDFSTEGTAESIYSKNLTWNIVGSSFNDCNYLVNSTSTAISNWHFKGKATFVGCGNYTVHLNNDQQTFAITRGADCLTLTLYDRVDIDIVPGTVSWTILRGGSWEKKLSGFTQDEVHAALYKTDCCVLTWRSVDRITERETITRESVSPDYIDNDLTDEINRRNSEWYLSLYKYSRVLCDISYPYEWHHPEYYREILKDAAKYDTVELFLEGSNDCVSWTSFLTLFIDGSADNNFNQPKSQKIFNKELYRYYRLHYFGNDLYSCVSGNNGDHRDTFPNGYNLYSPAIDVRGAANDKTPPVIELIGGEKIELDLGVTWVDPGATAYDEVDGDLTDQIVVEGTVNTSLSGMYVLTYSVEDTSGNKAIAQRVVIVFDHTQPPPTDTTPPVITIPGDNPLTITINSSFTPPTVTATDDVDGDVPVTATGTVDTATPGTYQITYTARDAAGNVATATLVVIVKDEDDKPPKPDNPDDDPPPAGKTFDVTVLDIEENKTSTALLKWSGWEDGIKIKMVYGSEQNYSFVSDRPIYIYGEEAINSGTAQAVSGFNLPGSGTTTVELSHPGLWHFILISDYDSIERSRYAMLGSTMGRVDDGDDYFSHFYPTALYSERTVYGEDWNELSRTQVNKTLLRVQSYPGYFDSSQWGDLLPFAIEVSGTPTSGDRHVVGGTEKYRQDTEAIATRNGETWCVHDTHESENPLSLWGLSYPQYARVNTPYNGAPTGRWTRAGLWASQYTVGYALALRGASFVECDNYEDFISWTEPGVLLFKNGLIVYAWAADEARQEGSEGVFTKSITTTNKLQGTNTTVYTREITYTFAETATNKSCTTSRTVVAVVSTEPQPPEPPGPYDPGVIEVYDVPRSLPSPVDMDKERYRQFLTLVERERIDELAVVCENNQLLVLPRESFYDSSWEINRTVSARCYTTSINQSTDIADVLDITTGESYTTRSATILAGAQTLTPPIIYDKTKRTSRPVTLAENESRDLTWIITEYYRLANGTEEYACEFDTALRFRGQCVVSHSINNDYIWMSWPSVNIGESGKYLIYRSVDGVNYRITGESTTNSFADTDTIPGVRYYYAIAAESVIDYVNAELLPGSTWRTYPTYGQLRSTSNICPIGNYKIGGYNTLGTQLTGLQLGKQWFRAVIVSSELDTAKTNAEGATLVSLDETPPVITLDPPTLDYTVEHCTWWDYPTATATDTTDGSVEVSRTDNVNLGIPGQYLVFYTATDTAGNIASATVTVTVTGTTITTTLTDLAGGTQWFRAVIEDDQFAWDNQVASVPSNTAETWIAARCATTLTGFGPGRHFVRAVIDNFLDGTTSNYDYAFLTAGISTTLTGLPTGQQWFRAFLDGEPDDTQTNTADVTLISDNPDPPEPDTIAPVILLTGQATITLTVGDTWTDPGATATDDTDENVSVTTSGTVDTATPGTYTINYSSTDTAGNTGTATRTVIVQAATPLPKLATPDAPTITPGTISATIAFTAVENATSYKVRWVVGTEDLSGEGIAIASGGSITGLADNTQYKLQIRAIANGYTSSDWSEVVTFETLDATILTLIGDSAYTIEVGDSLPADLGATLTADYSDTLTIETSGEIDNTTAGEYTRTYTAVDANNATAATISQTVYVVPAIVLSGTTADNIVAVGQTWTDPGITATNIDGSTATVTATGTVSTIAIGTATVTYTIAYSHGATITKTRLVYVVSCFRATAISANVIRVILPYRGYAIDVRRRKLDESDEWSTIKENLQVGLFDDDCTVEDSTLLQNVKYNYQYRETIDGTAGEWSESDIAWLTSTSPIRAISSNYALPTADNGVDITSIELGVSADSTYTQYQKGSVPTFLARLIDLERSGSNVIYPLDWTRITSMSYIIRKASNRYGGPAWQTVTGHVSVTIPSTAILEAFIKDDTWTADAVGYNFKFAPQWSQATPPFDDAGTYEIQFWIFLQDANPVTWSRRLVFV